jgi:hypothetical protein
MGNNQSFFSVVGMEKGIAFYAHREPFIKSMMEFDIFNSPFMLLI